jgi:signal recognition particle GTPase
MKSFEMTQKMMKQMKSEKGMKNVMRNLKGIDKDAFKDLKF